MPEHVGNCLKKELKGSIPSAQLYHCKKESHDWNLCTQVWFDLLIKSQNFSIFYFHIFHYVALLWTGEEGKKNPKTTQDTQFCNYHKKSSWIVLPYGNSHGNVMKKDASLTGSGTLPKTDAFPHLIDFKANMIAYTGYIHSWFLDYQVTFDGFRKDTWHIPFGNTQNPNTLYF